MISISSMKCYQQGRQQWSSGDTSKYVAKHHNCFERHPRPQFDYPTEAMVKVTISHLSVPRIGLLCVRRGPHQINPSPKGGCELGSLGAGPAWKPFPFSVAKTELCDLCLRRCPVPAGRKCRVAKNRKSLSGRDRLPTKLKRVFRNQRGGAQPLRWVSRPTALHRTDNDIATFQALKVSRF